MSNLIRLCSGLNSEIIKPIFKWKLHFGSILVKASNKNVVHDKKWCHFLRKKLRDSNTNSPSLGLKISVGVVTTLSLKLIRDNSVYCLKETKTRLNSIESSKKEPEFNWSKFLTLLQGYWLDLLGAILAAMICALLNIQIPRALGNMVNILSKLSAENQSSLSDLKTPAFHLISYYMLQSLFTFFYIVLLAHVGEGIAKTMKVQMFASVMNQDISFFDANRSGAILNRLTVDIQDFKSSFKMIISQGLKNITQIIGYSISLFLISPHMTGVMMVIVPTGILCGTYMGALLRQLSLRAKEQSSKVTLTAEEAIGNIRTVRSFAMEELENRIVDEQTEICKKLNIKLGYGIALFQAGTNLFLNGMVLGTIYLGSYMMTTGNLSAGDLMAFLVAVQMLQKSFAQISLLFGIYIKGKHAGARVFEIIDLTPGTTLKGGKKIPYHSLIPNVQFKDVVFSYPVRPEKEVLKKVNLYIPEGKTVAIVGSSGSGKSTLAWLLERFYDVQSGTVLIGEEDIKTLDANWLRKNVIGFISQEPILFATSVMENIRYGRPTATDEEVIEAAKLANADEFIRDFPNGYNTMVGERGTSVSGGQKQRIAIARALLKNPSILILDEATSALDSESEKVLQNSLEKVTKSRTTIIIAHRLSTIKNVDLIVVLHNGIIVESGTHRELLAKKGMYSALVLNQMENF